MAAYAALVSLINTIHNIHNHSRLSTCLDKSQIESLSSKLDFLLDFVEDHHSHGGDKEAEVLETQIASAAHAAEDVIETHIVDQIESLMPRFTADHEEATRSSLLLDLLMHIMLRIENHPCLSTTSLDREQIESVGEKLDFLLDLIENPNSHVCNEEVLEIQIESEARVIVDAFSFLNDRIDPYLAESIFPPLETISSWLLDYFVFVMEQILSYPRFWTCVESIPHRHELYDFLEDVTGSTFDDGQTSSSSMIDDLRKEVNAMKEKVMRVHEKICEKKALVFAGSGNCFLPDLQKVLEDMDSLTECVKEERGFKRLPPTHSMPAASSSSLTAGKTSVVGFESYFLQLWDWITAQQSDQQIIPITGMGGIGKTTLARKVYDDLRIVQHFDVRAWLTISQEYNVRDLLFHTLSLLGESTEELVNETEDELGVLIHKFLFGRRYLIILDDMWSIETWNEIGLYFPREEKGSRVVVTTRQSDMANHFGYLRLALDFLDDDRSWDLFCEKVFEHGCCPSELENIGRKIVKKCRGLPLSIIVIGGLLRKSLRVQKQWENVEKDLSSILNTTEDNHCFNILSLSYSHLPAHLKPCFLYLGVFPEDHNIRVTQLIQLWVAEGFLNPNKNPSLEEVGKGYIEDLVDRNLLLVGELSTIGNVKTCSLHDLLRDFCIKLAEKEKFFCLVREVDIPRDIGRDRRLINLESMSHPLQSTSLTRSVISEVLGHMTLNSRLLRVFYDAHVGSVGTAFQHFNLRFLQFQDNSLDELPSSIIFLWNLQTLIITGHNSYFSLPSEIWEMEQLKHLHVDKLYFIKQPLSNEKNRVVLRNLQTLQTLWIFSTIDEVCKRIPNIKKMSISVDCSDHTMSYDWFYHFGRLNKLESLHVASLEVSSAFAENIKLPSSLKKLCLRSCTLEWDDLTWIGSLPHLEVLKLDRCSVEGPEWNPIEGEFQHLKYLRISTSSGLRQWNAESCHFPVLEKLVIEELSELDEIPSGIGDIPTLGDIYLVDCSVSVVMSAVSILKEQESYGNEDIHVRVKFSNEKMREAVRKKIELEGFSNHKFQLF